MSAMIVTNVGATVRFGRIARGLTALILCSDPSKVSLGFQTRKPFNVTRHVSPCLDATRCAAWRVSLPVRPELFECVILLLHAGFKVHSRGVAEQFSYFSLGRATRHFDV